MKHYPQKVPKHKCKESKGDLVIRALLLTKIDLEHIMEVCFCYEHHQCTSTCINLLLSAILINLSSDAFLPESLQKAHSQPYKASEAIAWRLVSGVLIPLIYSLISITNSIIPLLVLQFLFINNKLRWELLAALYK